MIVKVTIDNNIYRKERIMEKRMLWLGVVIVVVALGSSGALATPMGPPTASLKQGQFKTGLEYFYSDMDLEMEGGKNVESYTEKYEDWSDSDAGGYKLLDKTLQAKMNKIYANLGYGIADNWEVFIRLGGVDGDLDFDLQSAVDLDEYPGADPNEVTTINFDGDFTFAYGIGSKATFWEQSPELKWGVLFQMSWSKLGFESKSKDVYYYKGKGYPTESGSESTELNISEIQIAVGPTWTPSEGFSIYGGPFLQFIDGDFTHKFDGMWIDYDEDGSVDGTGTEYENSSFDVSEDSCFGGYIGAQFNLKESCNLTTELAFTGDGWGLGASIALAF